MISSAIDRLIAVPALRNSICSASNRARVHSVFDYLKRQKFSPGLIYDVGANRGRWTRLSRQYFPRASYVLFEPQAGLHIHMQDLVRSQRVTVRPVGVSDRVGQLVLVRGKSDRGSNFWTTKENAERLGLSHTVAPVTTINTAIAAGGGRVPDILKIDAKGLDLKVLDGASAALGVSDVVFCEVAVLSNFENTLAEMLGRMADEGYDLVKITDINDSPKSHLTFLAELAFFRRDAGIRRDLPRY